MVGRVTPNSAICCTVWAAPSVVAEFVVRSLRATLGAVRSLQTARPLPDLPLPGDSIAVGGGGCCLRSST